MNRGDEKYRQAVRSFQEPVMPHQWERIDSELKESKKRFWTWKRMFFIQTVIVAGFCMGYFINSRNVGNQQTSQKSELAELQTNSNEDLNKLNLINEVKRDKIGSNSVDKLSETDNISTANRIIIKGNSSYNANRNTIEEVSSVFGKTKTNSLYGSPFSLGHSINSDNSRDQVSKSSKQTDVDDGKIEELSYETLLPNKDHNDDKVVADVQSDDTTKKMKSIEMKELVRQKKSRFAISLTYTKAFFNLRNNNIKNPEYLHKDATDLKNNFEKDRKNELISLGFDFYLFRNLNIQMNVACQYSQISKEENTDYIYDEIPWRDTDGRILGYFSVNDTSRKYYTFTSNNFTSVSYFQIPIKISKQLQFAKRHEISPSIGVNFSKIVSVKGNAFSVDQMGFTPLKSLINKKYGVWPSVGIQYSFNFYRSLWLGLEYQMQKYSSEMAFGYTSVKSNYLQSNLGLTIKYKL